MNQTNTVKSKVQNKNIKGWTIILCAALFFCYQFILRVSPNVINEELLQILAIDAGSLGFILGFYSWAYAGLQLPLGISMDRFGPKLFIVVGAIVCASGCFVFSLAQSAALASVARFMMGAGSSCGFLGCLKLGTLWFEQKDIGKVIGLTYLFGTLGATLGGTPLRYLYDHVGFVKMMHILGIIGFCIAGLILLIVSNYPKNTDINARTPQPANHPLHDLMVVIRNPQAWIIFFYSMLMYAPIAIMGEAWGVPFLEKVYEIEESMAAPLITFMFVGAAIGSPLFSTLSDRYKSRRTFMLMGTVMASIIYGFIVFHTGVTIKMMYVLLFIAGLAYAAKSIGFASICDIMPREMSGTAIAFINIGVMSVGTIFHPLIGYLVNLNWDGQMYMGSNLYSEENYRFALTIIPIVLVVSIILALIIKESHPEKKSKKRIVKTL